MKIILQLPLIFLETSFWLFWGLILLVFIAFKLVVKTWGELIDYGSYGVIEQAKLINMNVDPAEGEERIPSWKNELIGAL